MPILPRRSLADAVAAASHAEHVTLAATDQHLTVAGADMWLTAATQSCTALDFPWEHTRAHYWLGLAREALHQAGACDAYRVVVQRWGKASPPSITAKNALGKMKALGCAE